MKMTSSSAGHMRRNGKTINEPTLVTLLLPAGPARKLLKVAQADRISAGRFLGLAAANLIELYAMDLDFRLGLIRDIGATRAIRLAGDKALEFYLAWKAAHTEGRAEAPSWDQDFPQLERDLRAILDGRSVKAPPWLEWRL